jgi:hypothetical protein
MVLVDAPTQKLLSPVRPRVVHAPFNLSVHDPSAAFLH